MKRLIYLMPVLMFTACSETTENSSTADEVIAEITKVPLSKAQKVSFDDLRSADWENEKPIIVEGYIQAMSRSFASNGELTVALYPRHNQRNGSFVYLDIPVGKGNNQIAPVANEYAEKDIKIKDAAGNEIRPNSFVRITGYAKASKQSGGEPSTVFLDASVIEKLEGQTDYTVLNFPLLPAEKVEDPSAMNQPYSFEGMLSVPDFTHEVSGALSLQISDKKGNKIPAYVIIGDGPSQMAELSSSFSASDILIRDYQGKKLRLNTPVKVYGILTSSGLFIEEIIPKGS